MASLKNFKHMKISFQDGGAVLNLGTMEIWDGADLALLREAMNRMVLDQGCRMIGVDMSYVKYVPSGFFGMLFDWHERGIAIRLFTPQPRVEQMLWFTKFFRKLDNVAYELDSNTEEDLNAATPADDIDSEVAAQY